MEDLDLKKIYNGPPYVRAIVLAIASIILLFLAYFFDFKNLNIQYEANQEKIENIKLQFDSLIRKEISLATQTADFEKLKQIYAQIKTQVSPNANLNKVIDDVLKIGSFNNIYFSNFNPESEVKKDSYLVVPIKINGVGSYHQLANFISQIASMPYIVYIGDFNISSASSLPNSNTKPVENGDMLTANFYMEVYSLAK